MPSTYIASLGYRVDTRDLKKADKQLDKLARSGDAADRGMKKLSGGFKKLAGAVAIAYTALEGLGKVIEVTREFDVLNAQLITATGSAKDAAIAFGALQDFAATTPYDLQQSVKGFTQLVNLGLTPSEKALKSYGNTASAMGKDLSQMIEAVADASTGEFERLKEFGIKAKSEGDNVSFTFRGVTKTIGKNAAEIESYLMALGDNEFAGAMNERAKTLDGSISNLEDTWDSLFRTVSGSGVGGHIQKGVDMASDAIQYLIDLISSGTVGGYLDAFADKFSDITDAARVSFNFISGFINESVSGWLSDIGTFAKTVFTALSNLPITAKFYVQQVGVEISSLVDYAQVYGSAFVEMLDLKFQEIAERARILGRDLANAMNPFAEQYDAKADIKRNEEEYAQFYQGVLDNATVQAQAIRDQRMQSVESINLEKSAELQAYDDKLTAADMMLAKYREEKELRSSTTEDALEGFKLQTKALNDMKAANPFEQVTNGAIDSLSAMQSLSAQGSKEYRKLGVAIEAVNAIQAVGAVLNQAGGDPYTAFPRMAAMVASVASLGYSVGSIAGGLADESADNQEAQGLNVWGDKSESIANATDITASAVEKLVGINSDMLKALQTVQNGISKAAAIVGRDVTTPTINQDKLKFDYSDVMGIFEPLGLEKLIFDPLGIFGKTFNKLFGGSSKVTDEGIRIIGGSLGEMMDDITVLAFQSVKYKKWKFGSTKRKTQYKDITDDVGSQFQLILNSIADSVFLGATGLGLDSTAVEKAIQDFEIESFNISLKGLSAEDQQAEIEAVFGKIFDNLAGDVIPFLDKFQQVGEGLGETLARVSTQVSIMDLMVDQLGVTMFDKMANPEMYAQAADNISTLVGGIEEFADKTSGFVNNFATEATKIDIYQKSLTDSFNEVGLTLPGTAAGMWDLMASLDGSTEAGQEQIAMLLNSQEQAAAYFNLIEKTTKGYRDAIDAMYGVSDAVAQMSLDAALAAARMGDFSLAEQLSTNSLAPSMSSFGTRSEYELARAQTAAKLEELAQLTEGTISVDEKQLTTLEQIRDTIKDNGTIENTAAISELKKEVQAMNAVQVGQARNVADSNALLQQIVIDGIPVRVEE